MPSTYVYRFSELWRNHYTHGLLGRLVVVLVGKQLVAFLILISQVSRLHEKAKLLL